MAKVEAKLDPRNHWIAVTAIIVKDGKYLIAKRASWEKAFPDKWTVPGGKLNREEYKLKKTKGGVLQGYNIVEWGLRNEVKEEVNLQIHKPEYLCDLVFVRPDGIPVVTLSYWARYKSGKVKLPADLTEYTWVTLAEAKKYDLIEGIWDEIKMIDAILKKSKK